VLPESNNTFRKASFMNVETVIHNGILVTVNNRLDIIQKGWIGIRNSLIQAVEEGAPDLSTMVPQRCIDAKGGIVMPGLVNTHTHLPMTLFRGLADDLPLMTWLKDHIFPAESRYLEPETVYWGSRMACAEMLLSGTTCCCGGYFLEEHVARAVAETGMRAVLAQGVIDSPAPGVPDPKQNISHAANFTDKWLKRNALIQPSIFCHAPYTCSDETLKSAKSAATKRGLTLQIHAAETRLEREQSFRENGVGPVTHLDRLGLLDSGTILAHCVWVDEREMEVIATRGCTVAHCPESNMKLGSGIAPVKAMRDRGIVLGLGTDGSASNNNLDIFGEMDMVAKIQKVVSTDPTALCAPEVVKMATLDGARVIGMADRIGSLEVGKQADIIVLGTDSAHMTPLYHPESHIVYTANGGDVRDVFVGGKQVVLNREVLAFNVQETMDRVNHIAKRIKRVTF